MFIKSLPSGTIRNVTLVKYFHRSMLSRMPKVFWVAQCINFCCYDASPEIKEERRSLFQLIVTKPSIHDHLTPLLFGAQAVHPGRKNMVDQICSLHGVQGE